MSISIRDATLDDVDAIVEGNALMARETEGKTLPPAVLAAGVRAVLDDRKLGRYWVAVAAGRVIGQIMVTQEWSDWRNGAMWWIQSVHVAEDCRRRGVFTALYRHVEALARADSRCRGLRLYVDASNRRAQDTYTALGMVMPGYIVMETEFD